MEFYIICLFVMCIYHYHHMSEFPFFLRLNNFPPYVYTTFCLPTQPLTDTCVTSTFWLLRTILLWTWVCKYLFQTLLLIWGSIYLEVGLLDHMVILFLILWGMAILFLQCLHHFTFPTNYYFCAYALPYICHNSDYSRL